MRLYGITGGTGSGKSEAAKRFAERGIPVIDADLVGHEVIAPGGAAAEPVARVFGEAVLTGGQIDRVKLSAVVFRDAASLQKLNTIVHPLIFGEIGARCARLHEAGHHAVLVDAALLGENGAREQWLAGLILVLASRDARTRRLAASRGIAEEEIARRMAAQTPPEHKIPIADWVIENNGSIEELYARVDEIAEVIHGQTLGS